MHDHSSFNIVGKTAHFFASNKPLSLILLVSVLVFGFFSFFLTPKQYNPEIVRPAFAISLSYIGATPEEAIDRVVYELVEKVSAVPGVDEVLTEVHDGAEIGTTVIFDVGYDKTKAKVDLLTQLEQHSYLAQGFITKPKIIEVNPETIPVLQIVFSSESETIQEVRDQVIAISHKLTGISEVSDASVYGGYTPTLVVEIDPVRMERAALTLFDIRNALQQGNSRAVFSGYEDGEYVMNAIYDGHLTSPEEVGALKIHDTIAIRDVASVYEGSSPSRSYVLHSTKGKKTGEVVMLSISKVEGSSAPDVTTAVRREVDALLKDGSFENLTYAVVSDDGETATQEINGLTINLIQSIAIVAIVLILFLSIRAASIVLIAIPTTLLIVFGLGFLFDQTINRITLFALILSLGLLVDASIVVVENMYVHLRRASTNLIEATREIIIAGSVNEIGVGLFLSTVTSVIVFLPMHYITGMMGPYMGPIAFFVPAALTVSMLVAIIIVPYVASHILRPDEEPTWISKVVDLYTQRLINGYKNMIKKIVYTRSLQKKVLLGALGLFLSVLVFPLIGLEHFQMLPRADRDQFYVYIDAPVDSALENTKNISETIASLITNNSDVVSVQQFVGTQPIVDFNGMFKGAQYRNQKYQATLRVNLIDSDSREKSSTDIATSIRHTLLQTYPQYADMTRFIEEPPGPPVRATLVAKISSHDEGSALEVGTAFRSLITDVSGVVDPYITRDEPVGVITYTLDHEKTAQLHIAESDVIDTLRLIDRGLYATEYKGDDVSEFTPITLTLSRTYTDEPTDINTLTVRSREGKIIPIISVLDISHHARAQTKYLERGNEVVYVTSEVESRPIIYVIIDIIKGLMHGGVAGYTINHFGLFSLELVHEDGGIVTLTWGGEWEMTLENFRDLGIAMGVALLLVYATLVAQYQSFKKPGFVMITVPLGLIGILSGFVLLDNVFGIYLTATALIGFIALIGIVVNNAIIFSEYVEQEVDDGASYHEALVEAGGARFRPIMLTSLTTVLGSLTIASDPVWSGLAWSIVFGLSLSTILTLIVYPTLLAFFGRGDDD